MSSKIREALDKIGNISAYVAEASGNAETAKYMNDIIAIVQEALAEPLRNCDVGTPEKQVKRFYKFCIANSSPIQGMCDRSCPCIDSGDMSHCLAKWEQMPYEREVSNDQSI